MWSKTALGCIFWEANRLFSSVRSERKQVFRLYPSALLGSLHCLSSKIPTAKPMDVPTEKSVKMIASFSMTGEFAPAFELLLGIHPEEQRHLNEDEEQAVFMLRYFKKSDLLKIKNPNSAIEIALLWLKHYPGIETLVSVSDHDLYDVLWKSAFEKAEPLRIGYAFYPAGFNATSFGEVLQKTKKVDNAAKLIQQEIEELSSFDPRSQGKITWTLPFPADGPLGKVVENKAGLSAEFKKRIGLTRYSPGLLCNYLLQRNVAIEKVINPDQFEDLATIIFQEEGWSAEKTRKTRDGGKDVIARRLLGDKPFLAYIQAKRYKETRKVGISEVKEFVATVAGDGIDKGFIVTSSYFSRDSVKWLTTKGISLANVEMINRKELVSRMQKIADADTAAYLLGG